MNPLCLQIKGYPIFTDVLNKINDYEKIMKTYLYTSYVSKKHVSVSKQNSFRFLLTVSSSNKESGNFV